MSTQKDGLKEKIDSAIKNSKRWKLKRSRLVQAILEVVEDYFDEHEKSAPEREYFHAGFRQGYTCLDKSSKLKEKDIDLFLFAFEEGMQKKLDSKKSE